MHEAAHTQWDANGQLEVLTFNLQEETFALEAISVREILDLLPETAVPGARPLVGSVVNFRGKIIPIADLRLAFGMPQGAPTVDSRIVVIETEIDGETLQLGIRTDKVHEVTILARDASEEPPAVGMRWRRDYVRELVRRQDGVIVLPDLPAIFHALTGDGDPAVAPSSIH
ncbi:chemotaxis protein CheW [Sphingomonas sp. dw_22]|uniref:chemotaxis protein CheW n=1 Tax=Sphingomonas sp. dw_22 TaxID=2721175 RepID=UPI001BD1C724|nr:chemotaxis protein CheW [Sphingomonas sp. dw_22]